MKYFYNSTASLSMVPLLLCAAMPVQASNPVAYDAASIAQGAQLYQQFCTQCHGKDGRAQMDVISDATDLTFPEDYYNGKGWMYVSLPICFLTCTSSTSGS